MFLFHVVTELFLQIGQLILVLVYKLQLVLIVGDLLCLLLNFVLQKVGLLLDCFVILELAL